jgi:hypothetical protein
MDETGRNWTEMEKRAPSRDPGTDVPVVMMEKENVSILVKSHKSYVSHTLRCLPRR